MSKGKKREILIVTIILIIQTIVFTLAGINKSYMKMKEIIFYQYMKIKKMMFTHHYITYY